MVLGYLGRMSREGRQVDLHEHRNSADVEVGRDVGMVGTHHAVEGHKAHLWDRLCQNPGRRVDELGPKEERCYLDDYERTWRSELMVGRQADREDRARYNEVLDRLEGHEHHRCDSLVPVVHWTKRLGLCHCETLPAFAEAVASRVCGGAESVDGKLAHRGMVAVGQESMLFWEAIYHDILETSEFAAHVN